MPEGTRKPLLVDIPRACRVAQHDGEYREIINTLLAYLIASTSSERYSQLSATRQDRDSAHALAFEKGNPARSPWRLPGAGNRFALTL